MATKKTTTNKETTTKKTTSVKKAEETPKKTVAKKTAEDTVKKTASKKKEDTAKKETISKKETAVKKTASVKKAEETPKKTAAKKTAEDTSKKEDTIKKITVKKTSSVVKKEDEAKAIEKLDKTDKPKTLDSIIKKEEEKKEEKKDLKELIKSSQDRKISLKTSTPVRKIDSIKTENTDSKPERESITLLKEAIKAKSKNVSRPVSVKKRILIDDNDDSIANDNIPLNISKPVSSSIFNNNESIKEKDENTFSFNRFDSDKKENIEESDSEDKDNIYSKISSSAAVTDTYHFEKLDENKDIEEQKTYNIDLENEEKDEVTEEIDNTIDETEEDENLRNNDENSQDEEEIKEETEEIKEIAEVAEEDDTRENESIKEKATYSKSDIFKRVVIPNLNDSEEIQKSKFNQEEMDKAVENAPIIHENEKVENYKNYTLDKTIEDEKTENNEKIQELIEKDIKIIETEDELKTSSFPEIERKPVKPYVAPAHSMENDKKQNKLVPIIGIIIIILGLSFLGIQFFTGKNNNNTDDGFYDIVTNETVNNNPDTNNNTALIDKTNTIKKDETNNTRPQTNNAVNTQTNTARPQTNAVKPQTNNTRPQTNNEVNTQTNTRVQTNTTPPTPPKEPEITPPTPPPNPPTANNTNASISGMNQNNNNISGLNTYKTQWNDTLSSIATKELGDGRRWPSIFVLNQDLMKSPDNIVFNIYIKIPKGGKKKVDDMTDNEKRSLYNDYLKVAEIYSKIGQENQANRIKSQANSILK